MNEEEQYSPRTMYETSVPFRSPISSLGTILLLINRASRPFLKLAKSTSKPVLFLFAYGPLSCMAHSVLPVCVRVYVYVPRSCRHTEPCVLSHDQTTPQGEGVAYQLPLRHHVPSVRLVDSYRREESLYVCNQVFRANEEEYNAADEKRKTILTAMSGGPEAADATRRMNLVGCLFT